MRPEVLVAPQITLVVFLDTEPYYCSGGNSDLLCIRSSGDKQDEALLFACDAYRHRYTSLAAQRTRHFSLHLCFLLLILLFKDTAKGLPGALTCKKAGTHTPEKIYMRNKCLHARVTLLLDVNTNAKEPAVYITGAISKPKHIEPGSHRLSDEKAVNVGSYSWISGRFAAHLFLVAFWTYLPQVITDSMYLKELKTSACKMWT